MNQKPLIAALCAAASQLHYSPACAIRDMTHLALRQAGSCHAPYFICYNSLLRFHSEERGRDTRLVVPGELRVRRVPAARWVLRMRAHRPRRHAAATRGRWGRHAAHTHLHRQ